MGACESSDPVTSLVWMMLALVAICGASTSTASLAAVGEASVPSLDSILASRTALRERRTVMGGYSSGGLSEFGVGGQPRVLVGDCRSAGDGNAGGDGRRGLGREVRIA